MNTTFILKTKHSKSLFKAEIQNVLHTVALCSREGTDMMFKLQSCWRLDIYFNQPLQYFRKYYN